MVSTLSVYHYNQGQIPAPCLVLPMDSQQPLPPGSLPGFPGQHWASLRLPHSPQQALGDEKREPLPLFPSQNLLLQSQPRLARQALSCND